MTRLERRPLWRGRVLALVGIVLFAFSMRTAVASLSPVLGAIEAEYAVPAVVVGIIGTLPPLCFAAFGIFTPFLERRLGLARLAAIAMVVAAIGLTARALANDATSLLISTAVIFAAIGVGNVMLPPLVKQYYPDRIGTVTTIYTVSMSLSTFLPPTLAVPVADAAGWRSSLGLWAVFAAVAIIPWVALVVNERRAAASADDVVDKTNTGVLGRMWRLPLAWALMVVFAVSGVIAYIAFAWLPQLLVDTAGVTPAVAGSMLGLLAMMGLPASLFVPLLVVRYNATGVLIGIGVTSALIGTGGLLFAPAAAPWLWAPLLGIGNLLFPLALVLLGVRVRTHEASVALSGFVQSVGYAIVAVFPLTFGLLHDATGGWTVSLWVLAAAIATAIPAGFIAASPHTIEDEWERRHGRW